MTPYAVQGKVVSRANGQPVQHAVVKVFLVAKAGTGYSVSLVATSPVNITTDINGNFNGSFSAAATPSIIFCVYQNVDGQNKTIYNELPAVNTRWNIGNVVYNILKVDDAITSHPPTTTQPVGNYFVFTRIGNIGVESISQTNGYAYPFPPVPMPSPAPVQSMDSNQPFGATLWVAGWFGKLLMKPPYNIQYYKLQYTPGVHLPSDPVPWTDITDPLTNSWYNQAAQRWETAFMGPNGSEHYYYLPWNTDNIAWCFPDLLARWDTTKVSDGVFTLRVVGYSPQGTGVAMVQVPVDATYGSLKVQVDNLPPQCRIIDPIHFRPAGTQNDIEVKACDFVQFNGTIKIDLTALDPKGHLRLYALDAYYGHNKVVTPRPSLAYSDYASHPGLLWNGASPINVEYQSTPPAPDTTGYNSTEMPTCAYQFRLRVDKRTTNGYGLVYWGYEDNYHITIQR
jgi:hypothetical protein